MQIREWYFVCVKDADLLEVQRLNADGQATSWVHFQDGDRVVEIDTLPVPRAVLEIAERCRQIGGQYVGPDGRLLDYDGQPLP